MQSSEWIYTAVKQKIQKLITGGGRPQTVSLITALRSAASVGCNLRDVILSPAGESVVSVLD